ncbi:MAG: redoxin domain-containing protein [Planctomycetes bacterium]|nr:redoxin domain-containing protein [Planctomycetota bacterium]
MRSISTYILCAILLSLAGMAHAADVPEFTGTWVVDGPYTKEGLKGKVVVLYFFEEGCPTCRGRWPGLLQTSKQFENDPVLFVGINSGNAKNVVEGYAKGVNAPGTGWAFYVDSDRSFEKKTINMEISLQNIYQAMIMDPSGDAKMINAEKLADAVKSALPGAKWKIDAAEVPDALKKAWRMFEFGRTGDAAPLVKQALASSDPKAKAAAQKMEAAIKEEIEKALTDAKAKLDAGDKWVAYKKYEAVSVTYKDFAESKPAGAELSKLRGDPKVAKEIQAKGMLDKANEMIASPNKSVSAQGKQGLDAIIAQFPETEAAETAKSLKK